MDHAKQEKTGFRFSAHDLAEFRPVTGEEYKASGSDYIRWGIDNRYPEYLWRIYSECATLQSIINGTLDFILGNGLVIKDELKDVLEQHNDLGESGYDVIRKAAFDRLVYGGFAIQVRYNSIGDVLDIAHVEFRRCRVDNPLTGVYVASRWGAYSQKNYTRYNVFNPKTAKPDEIQVYYYKGKLSPGCYPMPEYSAALISAETQIEIQKFHINEILNNFMVSGILNFNNGVPEQEIMAQTEEKVKQKFTGTENAASLMLSWNDSKDKATTFERLSSDDYDKRYETLSVSSRENLFISMRAHPQLFGLPISSGFAEIEYEEAFRLYNKTSVLPKQQELCGAIDDIFGVQDAVKFLPFTLDEPEADQPQPDVSEAGLEVLTVNERRARLGYPELDEQAASTVTLAGRLGATGVQSLLTVLTNVNLTTAEKRGTLRLLFGLSDDDLNTLIPTLRNYEK